MIYLSSQLNQEENIQLVCQGIEKHGFMLLCFFGWETVFLKSLMNAPHRNMASRSCKNESVGNLISTTLILPWRPTYIVVSKTFMCCTSETLLFMVLQQEGLDLMTTFSFSHGKEQIAVELQTRKQIRQGANDLFSQRQGCQEAEL